MFTFEKGGGPAFPFEYGQTMYLTDFGGGAPSMDPPATARIIHPGMTLRDWLIGTLLSGGVVRIPGGFLDEYLDTAEKIADAYIARRDKREFDEHDKEITDALTKAGLGPPKPAAWNPVDGDGSGELTGRGVENWPLDDVARAAIGSSSSALAELSRRAVGLSVGISTGQRNAADYYRYLADSIKSAHASGREFRKSDLDDGPPHSSPRETSTEWVWPAWLKAPWIAMDDDGVWGAYSKRPYISDQDTCWVVRAGDAVDLTMFDFTPPPCTDWKTSLRKNPNLKETT